MGYSISIKLNEKSEPLKRCLDGYDWTGVPGLRYAGVDTSYGPKNSFGFDYSSMGHEMHIGCYRFIYELSVLAGQEGAYFYDEELVKEPKPELSQFFVDMVDNKLIDEYEEIFNKILTTVRGELYKKA
jgi:hypothetical protein